MKNFYATILLMFIALINAFGQFDATITITDDQTFLPLENVEVFLGGQTLFTNAAGEVTYTNLGDDSYDFNYSLACYQMGFGTVVIAGSNVSQIAPMTANTSNNVFFFIGDPLTLPGATVSLYNNDGYFQSITTGNFLGDIINDVPYGEYSYSVEAPCYQSIFGTVTVDCAEGNGVLVAENPVENTTNSVFFFIGDPLTLPGATVSLYNNDGYFQSITTGNFLGDIINDVPYGEYSYSVEAPCYQSIFGTVTVDCAEGNGVVVAEIPVENTSNSVFFFIGDPLTLPGATVSLYNNDGYFQSITTGNFLGDIINDVPYGEYSYSVEAPCYQSIFGTVTVDCAEGNGVVVAEIPVENTTNSVFFFIGDPLTLPGATVSLYNNDGYFQSITTGNFLGDIINDVPYGEYSYSVEAPCYQSIFGTVTVDCAEGNGVVVAEIPVENTTNSVFFFIGDPLTLPGATVTLFNDDGYSESLVTGNFLGDILSDVPYGEYSYTVEAPCHEPITGTVTVDCAEGNGNVVAEIPVEIVLDNSVTADANTLTATAAGLSYQWVDCDDENAEIDGATEQSFTASEDGNYAVIISSENCSTTSDCVAVIVSGIFDASPSLEVSVYPNPFSSNLIVSMESTDGNTAVEILSITGKLIVKENFASSSLMNLELSDLSPGTYLIRVSNDHGQYTRPIIKQ